MQSLWKKSFIVVVVVLVISICIGGDLWYQLDSTRLELYATKAQLDTTEKELEVTKTQLDTTKSQLDATKTQLEGTENELNTATAQLGITKTELEATKTQLKAAENKQIQMLNDYSELREQINIRLGKEQDTQSFITPDDSEVSAKVQEITGDYSEDVNELWRDYERLYRWVVKNIGYNEDSYTPFLPDVMNGNLRWAHEFWRMPAETLDDKVGDCEDMAVLLASMLSNYNQGDYAVWALGIKNKDTAHLAVAFPVEGNKLTILDPAGNYYTGYYSGGLRADDTAVAVSAWLSHWAKEMPSAQIDEVFSNEFYREFSSTDEFINWVRTR